MTTAFVFFALLGLVAGYTSARVYKMFGGVQRKIVVLRTALWLPGLFFGIFMLLDLWIWHEGSVGAVPIGTLLLIIAFWFGISVPLVFFGAFLGYKSKVRPSCSSAFQCFCAQPTRLLSLLFFLEVLAGCGVSRQAYDHPQTATGAAILHAHGCHEPGRRSSRICHCVCAGVFRVHKGRCHLREMNNDRNSILYFIYI